MTEDKELIDYLEKEKLLSRMMGIGVKLFLSGLLIWLTLVGSLAYFACSLFQFSLRLTNSYIVAIIVFVAIIAGIFLFMDKVSDSVESETWQIVIGVSILIASNIFLVVDIYRVVKYIDYHRRHHSY